MRGRDVRDEDVERRIRAVMAQLLEYESVPADQDFFAGGGNSLLATKLVARLRSVLGAELSVRTVAQHRTPAALAAVLAAVDGAGKSAAFASLARTPKEKVRGPKMLWTPIVASVNTFGWIAWFAYGRRK